MNSLEEIIYESCQNYPGGTKLLASDLSVNLHTLYNKCNPKMLSHNLNILETLKLMQGSSNTCILDALCQITHHACVSKPDFSHISDMILFEAWTTLDLEHGITAKAIRDALQDKHIEQAEYQKIHTEMFVDFARELELLDRLRHFSGKYDDASTDYPPIEKAIYSTIFDSHPSVEDISEGINIRMSELKKKADHENHTNIFTIQESLKLIQFTNNYVILHSLSQQLGHMCVEIPQYKGKNDTELLDAWSSWSDERSDTISLIHDSLTDGEIEEEELNKIEKEIYQDFYKELALLARLELML